MAKVKDYDMEAMDELCDLGKALSSPIRLKILQLLYEESLIIGEIARKLELPASSTAFHLKILEEAGLIRIEEQPGTRGNTRLCTRKVDHVTINLVKKNTNVTEVFSEEMPVGAFTSCQITPTCGMYGPNGCIGNEDIAQKLLRYEAVYLYARIDNFIKPDLSFKDQQSSRFRL